MTDKLRDAAQAIVDRWDSPAWGGSAENLRHTGEYIAELRAALAQQDAQAVPVVWMGKMDFEALKLRGRVTATLYGEPVGNKTHEVGLCLATPTPPCRRNNHD